MSENSVNPVSSGPVELNPVPLGTSGGKVGPDVGKMSPRQLASIRALKLDNLVKGLNSRSRSVSPSLRFQVDVKSGSSVIQVFNRGSGKFIRQIPLEKANALAKGNGAIGLRGIDDLV